VTRILTGAVLVALSVGVIVLAPSWLFWILLLVTASGAAWEFGKLMEACQRPSWVSLGIPGTLATALAFYSGAQPLGITLVGCTLAVFVTAVFAPDGPRERLDRIGSTLLLIVYLGLGFGHVGGLYENGPRLLLFAILVVYCGDVAAYYGGRAFGRVKLAPRLSPAKTWEGAISGVAGAAAAAIGGSIWLVPALAPAPAAAAGALLGIAGILGDLVESLVKRAGGTKDSSTLLPGHGGVLDRLDSLLLGAPVLYWCVRLGLAGY
jgi:phosphatidate cytidylyltransferase